MVRKIYKFYYILFSFGGDVNVNVGNIFVYVGLFFGGGVKFGGVGIMNFGFGG